MPEPSTSPAVTVVVPARGAADDLPAAVGSALGQEGIGALEVVVAVASDDPATRDVAERLAAVDDRVVVVENPSSSTPAALNRAIEVARAPVVVRLDAHAVLPPGYVARAVQVLEETGAGNVGGRQVPTAERGFAAAVATAMRSPLGSGGAAYRGGTEPGPVETVYLGVFRREALAEVGGFDERLLRNQDYELNHRLRRAGWTVWFDPELAVAYRPRDSVRSLARQYRGYGQFKRVVMTENPDSIRPRQLAPLLMVLGVAGAVALGVARRAWGPPAMAVGGYTGAVLAAAARADRRRTLDVALALATMHWSWAIGFLQGARGRAPRPGATRHG